MKKSLLILVAVFLSFGMGQAMPPNKSEADKYENRTIPYYDIEEMTDVMKIGELENIETAIFRENMIIREDSKEFIPGMSVQVRWIRNVDSVALLFLY